MNHTLKGPQSTYTTVQGVSKSYGPLLSVLFLFTQCVEESVCQFIAKNKAVLKGCNGVLSHTSWLLLGLGLWCQLFLV